jgi:hypothetical protein
MFRSSPVTQNKIIAQRMRRFFSSHLPDGRRADPEAVAMAYTHYVMGALGSRLIDEKKMSRSRFHVALAVEDRAFDTMTKRSVLVSDTLLLSHDGRGAFHEHRHTRDDGALADNDGYTGFGFRCPHLGDLGQWILDAEHLLKAGLVWYLPSYERNSAPLDREGPAEITVPVGLMDYLIKDGRAIDASGADPLKGSLVRPILQIDLPFVDGVGLRDFSKITVEEFDSYQAFRGFLRKRFLDLDDALDAVQSERALAGISQEIADQVRSVRSLMSQARRKRAVEATGAGIGTVSAALVAVYGPALQEALAMVGSGAGGAGVWAFITALSNNNPRYVDGADDWAYVWALQREAQRL